MSATGGAMPPRDRLAVRFGAMPFADATRRYDAIERPLSRRPMGKAVPAIDAAAADQGGEQ